MRYDKSFRNKARKKLKLFLENRNHPLLRYKKVQALKHEKPPVYEISVDMDIIEFQIMISGQDRGKQAWRKSMTDNTDRIFNLDLYRITLQIFEDHIYLRNIGGHNNFTINMAPKSEILFYLSNFYLSRKKLIPVYNYLIFLIFNF